MAPRGAPAINRANTTAASWCALINQILAGGQLLQHHAVGAGQSRESAPRSAPAIARTPRRPRHGGTACDFLKLLRRFGIAATGFSEEKVCKLFRYITNYEGEFRGNGI